MFKIRFIGFLIVLLSCASAQENLKGRGGAHLKELLLQEWAAGWNGSTLKSVRLVEPKSDLEQPTGLPAVWFAEIDGTDEQSGYLIWENVGDGQLLECALDGSITISGKNVKAIKGVKNLQQFAVEDDGGGLIASGCVPTSAASVLHFWTKQFPQWKGEDGKTLEGLTKRIRARLDMKRFPDKDGFTENGMALAGAYPHKLAAAIRADAQEHGVGIECAISKFSMKRLKAEIDASRPVLVSCVVRVPHKPELSWGHEMVAVGWAEFGGVELVGVLDNFYPTKNPETIRWIRKDAFSSLITIRKKSEG